MGLNVGGTAEDKPFRPTRRKGFLFQVLALRNGFLDSKASCILTIRGSIKAVLGGAG